MLKNILVLIISLALTCTIGYLDLITGQEIVLTIFYLIPAAIAVWYSELLYGLLMSVIASVVWYFIEKNSGQIYSSSEILTWDTFVLFLFLFIFVLMLNFIKKLMEKEKQTARTDYLTGLANRRYFMESIEAEMSRTLRSGGEFTLAYFDSDNFKHVNDTLGHYAGDMVLQITANVLKEHTRKMDRIARLGGDEFGILFPRLGIKDAGIILEKLKDGLNEAMQKNGYPVTFSIGAVVFTKMPSSADDIIRMADKLMYEVKKEGKNSLKLSVY